MAAPNPERGEVFNVDLRQLRYFLAIADAGSIAQAARNLFVTQPTLVVSLKKLEADLQAPLFHRGATSHYRLTRAGQLLYERGRELSDSLEELEATIHQMGVEQRETLRIGITVLFAMQFMPSISSFIETHPSIDVTLTQGGSRELQGSLAKGDIDVGLLSFPIYEPDVAIEALACGVGSYNVAVVMLDSNPLAKRSSVTFADLHAQRFCTLSDKFVLGTILEQRCRAAGFEPDIAIVNDDWEVLLTAMENLNGVCLIPSGLRSFSAQKNLAWVPLDDKINVLPIGFATPRNRDLSHAAEAFITTMRQALPAQLHSATQATPVG